MYRCCRRHVSVDKHIACNEQTQDKECNETREVTLDESIDSINVG